MKFLVFFLVGICVIFGCSSPKPKTEAPNLNWTEMDEPPLFSGCPTSDAVANWHCFSKMLQQKLEKKLKPLSDSFAVSYDSIFISLKVDTTGQVSVIGLAQNSEHKAHPLLLSSVTEVIQTLPPMQPAFKTNLEIPVEVSWTLPVILSR
jgi:hypothetical protein